MEAKGWGYTSAGELPMNDEKRLVKVSFELSLFLMEMAVGSPVRKTGAHLMH